jgi:hypothetical protein
VTVLWAYGAVTAVRRPQRNRSGSWCTGFRRMEESLSATSEAARKRRRFTCLECGFRAKLNGQGRALLSRSAGEAIVARLLRG